MPDKKEMIKKVSEKISNAATWLIEDIFKLIPTHLRLEKKAGDEIIFSDSDKENFLYKEYDQLIQLQKSMQEMIESNFSFRKKIAFGKKLLSVKELFPSVINNNITFEAAVALRHFLLTIHEIENIYNYLNRNDIASEFDTKSNKSLKSLMTKHYPIYFESLEKSYSELQKKIAQNTPRLSS